MGGFDALGSLTGGRVRPFDRRRSGLLLGEGAGLVLMAREADARGPRLGRLLGHASASDGSHLTAPAPDGRGLEFAVRAAMAEAGAAPSRAGLGGAPPPPPPLDARARTAVGPPGAGPPAPRSPVAPHTTGRA